MRRALGENGLTVAFVLLFLGSLVGQALVGHSAFNHEQAASASEAVPLLRYVTSSAYLGDVMENWQSEYLQFTLYILATVWLVQRGSPESKPAGHDGTESDEQQLIGRHAMAHSPRSAKVGGLRTQLYSNSLVLVMGGIWLLTWTAQAVTGRIAYNAAQLGRHEATLSLWQYVGSSDFWNRTLQNWQSEFLAVASMIIFSVWLRQRGSSQSKPVGETHAATGVDG